MSVRNNIRVVSNVLHITQTIRIFRYGDLAIVIKGQDRLV